MPKQEWWREFFHGLPVGLWLKFEQKLPTTEEAGFIEEVLEVPKGGRVLDVPCGGGRHSLELARRGYEVTGVDFSDEFLSTGHSRAAADDLKVDWQQRDMRDLPWPGTFAGAFSFGNSFGYLDDEGNRAFLRAVAESLAPGGRFIIETGTLAESLLPSLETRTWYAAGSIRMLIENRHDVETSRLYTDYTFLRNGELVKRTGFHRIHTYREFCEMLEAAGFTDLQGYASTDREPYKLGSKRLIMVGKKKA